MLKSFFDVVISFIASQMKRESDVIKMVSKAKPFITRWS